MTYALVRAVPGATHMDLESFAHAAGLHPEMVHRLVVLGLVDAVPDADGTPWFAPAQLAAVARIRRLRAGFSLNYAALGLVLDLLDRIAELEARPGRRRTGG